ncbi:MAG: abortive infection family protein [Sedimentisphaerales bacterium]|nr:abortive infection family protein [Sedimentisphaerales bacterium]
MTNVIPSSVIAAVSSVIAEYYYSHKKLNSLFMENGAPGDAPEGNCESKCISWLKRCNDNPDVDALAVLGQVIQRFMDQEPGRFDERIREGQERISKSLTNNHLSYQMNGLIVFAGTSPSAKTLADYFKEGDFPSIEAEFSRAIKQIDSDPPAAITAASSIIESLCKTYIDTVGLEIPTKQTIVPLWKVVQQHMGLNINQTLQEDQRKILQGLAAIVDGIGSYRTHAGSAHGRGAQPSQITVAEARLAVNASHTLVLFIMEQWQKQK